MDTRDKDVKEKGALVETAKAAATLQKIIIGVRDDDLAAEIYADKAGIELEEARAAVKKMRRKITARAGSVDVQKELGEHLAALNALYSTATQAQDLKTALAVEKERGKTLSLYNKINEQEKAKTDKEKEEARRILEAVFVDSPGPTRLDDMARAVVNRLIAAESS